MTPVPAKFDLPILDDNGKNYKLWSMALMLIFTNCSIWPIIDGTEVCPDLTTDPAAHDEWCLKDHKA